MFTAEVVVKFSNGSEGAKVFEAKTRELVTYDASYYVYQLVNKCREDAEGPQVVSHKIITKTSNSWIESEEKHIEDMANAELDFDAIRY